MTLKTDLVEQVRETFRNQWVTRSGRVVPEPTSVGLGNDGVLIDAVVLYADMDGSTSLVDDYEREFAAEVYKSYLYCAAKIIRSNNGVIAAYDGDRVMAIFIEKNLNSQAVKTALQINSARIHIVNALIESCYPEAGYKLQHNVGVDRSELMAANTGIRGSNDLVWVGPAANWAAKMTAISNSSVHTWISPKVYEMLSKDAKYSNGTNMWKKYTWTQYKKPIYGSSYSWKLA